MSEHCSGRATPALPGPDAATGERPLVLLIGRPNSGKSSLFNRLTGQHAHVGNFPGVTVEILEASVTLPSGLEATIADLPGLYALDALSDPTTDEGVARAFLDQAERSGRPVLIAQVVDGTQLPLGLRLTRDLARRRLPLLLVVTQRDVLDGAGHRVDVDGLRAAIGARVVAVSSREAASRVEVFRAIQEAIEDAPPAPPDAWEPDTLGAQALLDREGAAARPDRRGSRTARLDEALLHPVIGPVVFLALTTAIFAAVFLISDPATAVIDAATGAAGARLTAWIGEGMLSSFLTAGVLGGAGTVLAFMPQIVVLTIALELLEATGYLARGAFLVDRLLRLLGLSGRSFFPLLMGHACAVPAISATRIIRDPRERLTAILVLPLMTCSARIPTYALLLGAFFGHRSALFRSGVFVGLYFAGMIAGLAASLVLRRTATRGRSLPLVLEMPSYRAPQGRVVARKAGRAAWRFFRDVGTTILAASVVLWALLTLPAPGSAPPAPPVATSITDAPAEPAAPIERSVAASIGRALEPVTRPLGFDWRINVGLIGSFGARELMVGTLGVIFGIENAADDPAPLSRRLREARGGDGHPAYSTRTGLALLAFFVVACQCTSTVAAIRRETRSFKWAAFVLGYTYALAYVVALAVHWLAGALGMA